MMKKILIVPFKDTKNFDFKSLDFFTALPILSNDYLRYKVIIVYDGLKTYKVIKDTSGCNIKNILSYSEITNLEIELESKEIKDFETYYDDFLIWR